MAKKKKTPPTMTETIRATIKARGLTAYRVGVATGMRPTMVQRFLDGFDLRGATLDRIGSALGLAIVETEEGHPDLKGKTDGIVP